MPKIGIDIGGVIIDSRRNDGTDTSFFSDNFLRTTAVLGAFQAIEVLVRRFGAENVYLVSKCGKRVEEKTKQWLAHHQFYERTGVLRHHVLFCLERKQKAEICRQLCITHFVDDHYEVLEALVLAGIGAAGKPTLYLFNPKPGEVHGPAVSMPILARMIIVHSWDSVVAHCRA